MAKNSSQSKAEFLGMPYGTAANRLRKMLMFKFAQELGYDYCFACGKKINEIEDLSIEHKKPWFNRDNGIELFWDIDNIAFSHLKCNIPDRTNFLTAAALKSKSLRKENKGPIGTSWCNSCKTFKEFSEFWKSSSKRYNGLQEHCKECQKARKRKN